MKPITVTTTGKQFATSTTAAATVLPFDSSGYYPKAIWVSATVPTYVKLTGPLSATAVAGDLLVQPADPVYLICSGYTGISALTLSGTGVLNVAPAEIGSWGDGTSLSLPFTSMTSLDSRITFARADATSCATYFDSTGRLQTAAANVARFDYDPATVAGVTGGELVTNGASGFSGTSGWTTNGGATLSTSGPELVISNPAGASFPGAAFQLTLEGGKTYQVTITCRIGSGTDTLGVNLNGTELNVIANTTTSSITRVYTGKCNAAGTQSLKIFSANGTSTVGTLIVSSVSVKEAVFTSRGLLIEESRTNLLLQSRDMTTASWGKTDTTPARTQVGIDGVANTACLMTEGSAGTSSTSQGATVAAGSTVTVSVVFKRGNTDWVRVVNCNPGIVNGAQAWFNLNTGAKGTASAIGTGSAISSSIQNLGGGWYRCSLTCLPDGTYTGANLLFHSASADNSSTRVNGATYIVDAAQLEVGSFATSPIITTAATVTRAADSASMTGSNFSSWYNTAAGTIVAEYVGSPTSGGTGSSIVRMGSTGPAIADNDTGTNARVSLTTVAFEDSGGTATTAGTIYKTAFAYAAANFGSSTNGGTVQTGGAETPAAQTAAYIGQNASLAQYANTWIRRITYYPTRLTNAQLQSLTT